MAAPFASRRTGTSGFTLVELLVALALTGLGLGALALMSSGVLAAFDANPAAAEQQQRGRATMAAIVEDAARAGMSFVDDAAGGPGRDVPSAVPDGWRHGAWTVIARPSMLAVMAGARTAAHARLPAAVPAGETRLVLDRPGYCSPASPTCRFAADDDVLIAGPDGAFALAAVRAASPPLVIDLVAPLAQAWPAGTRVSVVELRTYALRADAATGLDQIVRSQGAGPAMPLVDFVQGFEVEWLVAGAAPAVRLAPDATPEHATYGPLPPAEGVVRDLAWPAGENCVFARDAAGRQRFPAGAARRRCRGGAALALRRRAVVPVSRGPHALGRRPGASGWRAAAGRGGRGLGAAAAAVRGGDGPAGGQAPPRADTHAQRHRRSRAGVGGAVSGASGRDVAPAPGFALVVVLVWLALLAGLALGAALVTMYEPTSGAAAHERIRLRRAAESAVTLALLDLAARLDWSQLPAGGPASPFTDGGPGPRLVDGTAIDLVAETRWRTCGRPTACDDATIAAVTDGRPWGARNPRWRLFVNIPVSRLDASAAIVCPCYLAAWIADDPADDDGDPAADAPHGVDGHGVLLVRGAAYAAGGAVAEVEALVAQPCRRSGLICCSLRSARRRTVPAGTEEPGS